MRQAEWINLFYFSLFAVLAPARGLAPAKRNKAIAIGAAGVGLTLLGAFVIPRAVIRDWLPSVLLLMAYWQCGQFFTRADQALQDKLNNLDRRLVLPFLRFAGWAAAYLEAAYLSCYVVVPASLATLYILHRGAYADQFWTLVLSATYACYALLPYCQTLPPRMISGSTVLPSNRIREFNLVVLHHGSIQVNTFPSAHAATSLACGLALTVVAPLAGAAFIWIAVSISAGAVTGRYHYLADVVAGAMVALAAFALLR